jgi:hypothetical protein
LKGLISDSFDVQRSDPAEGNTTRKEEVRQSAHAPTEQCRPQESAATEAALTEINDAVGQFDNFERRVRKSISAESRRAGAQRTEVNPRKFRSNERIISERPQ